MALPSKRGFAKAALVSASSASIFFLMLRNVALAHLMTRNLYGVAITIYTFSAAADLLSDLGWDKFLIQSDVADRASSQAVVHFLRLITGAIVALLMTMVSPVLAYAIKVPEAAGAMAAVSIVIVLKSATHTDYKFRQRQMDFKGEMVVELTRSIADLLVAIVVGWLWKSYWAMTWALIVNAAVGCFVSHLMADQPYRAKWQPVLGRTIYHFGAPLFFNNFVIYLAGQGDRLMVSIIYGPFMVAIYGASLNLIAGPQTVIGRILMTLSLPILSRSRGDIKLYAQRHRQLGMAAICAAAAVSFPVIFLGSDLVRLIFGKAYRTDPALIAALVIPQSINIIRLWTMSSLMAHAKTRVIPFVNLTRVIGLVIATVFALRHNSLVFIAYCLMIGEIIGLVTQLVVHRRLIMKEDARIIVMLFILGMSWLLAIFFQAAITTIAIKLAMASLPVCAICLSAIALEFLPRKKRGQFA